MKVIHYIVLLIFASGFGAPTLVANEVELTPYFKIGSVSGSMDEATKMVHRALTAQGFTVIGEYHPEGSKKLKVIAYTRQDLQTLTLKVKDRGVLASILKIGMVQNADKIDVSMLNPMYLFYAYLRDEADKHLNGLHTISDDAKKAMQSVGSEFVGFGGSESAKDLKEYHYMAFMPYFDDPVELNEFNSFDEGVSRIRKNLAGKKGNSVGVYELVLKDQEVAIFGVGLFDPEAGEPKFLPIIGEENIAAMPYEIILSGTRASMLHGKFRIALHWPELSMGQFMKISSTPGDVEDFLRALTE